MRRLPVLLVFALMLVLSLLLAAVAAAASLDDFCDKYPEHQRCNTTTTSTTTPTEPPALPSCESGPIPVATGGNNFECEWTPDEDDAGWLPNDGTVTVNVASGDIGGLAIFVLDSFPGNICELVQINKPTALESASFPLVEGGNTYWNTDGTDWWAQYDEYGPKEDRNGAPLHVRVYFRAKKGTAVNVSFSPVNVADTP